MNDQYNITPICCPCWCRYERSVGEPSLSLEEAVSTYLPSGAINIVFLETQSHFWALLTALMDTGALHVSVDMSFGIFMPFYIEVLSQ